MPSLLLLAAAAAVAAVDYTALDVFANRDCSGPHWGTTVGNITGVCTQSRSSSSRSLLSCVDATNASILYYASSATCEGAPTATLYEFVGNGSCVDGQRVYCQAGNFTPSTAGLVLTTYAGATCPSTTGVITTQSSYTVGVCINGDLLNNALSYQLACNATGGVGTLYASPGCTGAGTTFTVIPSGCSAGNSTAVVNACSPSSGVGSTRLRMLAAAVGVVVAASLM